MGFLLGGGGRWDRFIGFFRFSVFRMALKFWEKEVD